MNLVPIPSDFFARAAPVVAPELIGHLLVHQTRDGETLIGRIVETEAYTENEPACHGWGVRDAATGRIRGERRGAALFGPPGKAYVYLNYGIHWLLNVVTEPEGSAGAVLIRAVEPLEGIALLRKNRPAARNLAELTNGPGRLTAAFQIDGRFRGHSLDTSPLFLAFDQGDSTRPLVSSRRIGISKATDLLWRFHVEGSPFVSHSRG